MYRATPTHHAMSAPRAVEQPAPEELTSHVGLPVEVEEDLLEVGRLREEVDDAVPGGQLDDTVHRRLGCREPEDGAVDVLDADARQRRERLGIDRRREDDRHVAQGPLAQGGDRVDVDEPAAADDPDAIRGLLHLVEGVRGEEDGAAGRRGLPHEQSELVLQQGSSPPVGSSRTSSSGRCMNACTSPSFWRLPFESSRIGRSSTTPKRSTSESRSRRIDRSAETGEGCELLVAREPVVQAQVARQVADPPAGSDAVAAAVEPEHERLTVGRPDHVEQQPDRRALAGAVRPQEAEDLAVLDAQVEAGQRAHPARVRLRQGEGLDCRSVRHHAAQV